MQANEIIYRLAGFLFGIKFQIKLTPEMHFSKKERLSRCILQLFP